MTQFAQIENGEITSFPLTIDQVRADLPGISLAFPYMPEDFYPLGFALVEKAQAPELYPGTFLSYGEPVEQEPGLWVRPYSIASATTEQFDAFETELHVQIDTSCGEFRKLFITDVPGQDETYTAKRAEAEAYVLNPQGDFPFLSAEAAATSRTVAQVAAEVSAVSGQWVVLGSSIEGMRIAAKRAVTLAKAQGDWVAMAEAAAVDWESLIS